MDLSLVPIEDIEEEINKRFGGGYILAYMFPQNNQQVQTIRTRWADSCYSNNLALSMQIQHDILNEKREESVD